MKTDWQLTKSFKSSFGKVAWDTFGRGPALVFVHGTPFSSFIWRKIAQSLQSQFTIYCFDLLGYGQSEKAQDISLGIQNIVFFELLNDWQLEQPNMVAHDFGGATALRTHLLNEYDYRNLILIDPVALKPWGSPFVQHVRAHEKAFSGMPSYIHQAILPSYIQGAAHKPLGDDAMQGHVAPWTSTEGQAAFYRQIAQMDQKYTDEIETLLPHIRCPTRIIWGQEDAWIPVQQGDKLAKMCEASHLRIVPNAGHMVQEDAPEIIIDEILGMMR